MIDAFVNVIERAFQSSNTYSKFEGATQVAQEGFFIGYKHSAAVGEALLLTKVYVINANIILFVRNSSLNDGTWSAYKLGISV